MRDIAQRGYALGALCLDCLRVGRLDANALGRRTDPRLPVAALRGRLRCSACRSHRVDFTVFRFESELQRWLRRQR